MKIESNRFQNQAKLMLEMMPFVAEEKCFALKGGTAINFFVRDMPRLSVDIDLTYLPLENRETSINNISEALKRIKENICASNSKLIVQEGLIKGSKHSVKLYVSFYQTQIKIEPNLVIRGSVFKTKKRKLVPSVQKLFDLTTSISTVSLADLYGGKICAALNRQHPRDLFDVKILLENEGLTDEIRKGFIIYLCSHDETISDLLAPKKKDIHKIFEDEFEDMPRTPVSLKNLISARGELITRINSDLTQNERKFLISLKKGEPDWQLFGVPGIEKLPAIQWKLQNIEKLKNSDPKKFKSAVARLIKKLEMD